MDNAFEFGRDGAKILTNRKNYWKKYNKYTSSVRITIKKLTKKNMGIITDKDGGTENCKDTYKSFRENRKKG